MKLPVIISILQMKIKKLVALKSKRCHSGIAKPESFLTILDLSRVLDHSSGNLHHQNMCNYHPEKLASYCKIRQSNKCRSFIECRTSQTHPIVSSKQIHQQGFKLSSCYYKKIMAKLCKSHVTLDQ